MAPVYALHYFPAAGRAEQIRMILAHAGVEFEDIRHPQSEWPSIKHDRKRFPLLQVPTLEVKSTGHVVFQSMVIVRYLAREHSLYGHGSNEQVIVDEAIEMFGTLQQGFVEILFAPSEDVKKVRIAEYPTKFEPILHKFEELLHSNPSGFIVGNKPTAADIQLASVKEAIEAAVPGLLEKYPAIRAVIEKVRDTPNLKKYLSSRSS